MKLAFAGNLDFFLPPAVQFTIFHQQNSPEVLSIKHALHVTKLFLNT
jgi:hypothetical protein